jgi:hypothetical protein
MQSPTVWRYGSARIRSREELDCRSLSQFQLEQVGDFRDVDVLGELFEGESIRQLNLLWSGTKVHQSYHRNQLAEFAFIGLTSRRMRALIIALARVFAAWVAPWKSARPARQMEQVQWLNSKGIEKL